MNRYQIPREETSSNLTTLVNWSIKKKKKKKNEKDDRHILQHNSISISVSDTKILE